MRIVYPDPLWGVIPITEPVLAELIRSAPVQRLQGIRQAGASYYLHPEMRAHTRFDHSLGVMRLLAMLGAGLEEQVAGLLHDAPHTAFSHTVDIIFQSDEHNFHEMFQRDTIMRSAIPDTLSRHGIVLGAALEPEGYPLLERPLPDLCADRIDYALRDMHAVGRVTTGEARQFVGHLIPTPQGIVVGDPDAALWFADMFREANESLWTSPDDAGAYWALACTISRAYAIGTFTDADLFSTDDAAMEKLRAPGDPILDAYLSLLAPGVNFYEVETPGPYFATRMKQRAVDPLVLGSGWPAPRRLSSISQEHAGQLSAAAPGLSKHYRLWSDAIPPILRDGVGGHDLP